MNIILYTSALGPSKEKTALGPCSPWLTICLTQSSTLACSPNSAIALYFNAPPTLPPVVSLPRAAPMLLLLLNMFPPEVVELGFGELTREFAREWFVELECELEKVFSLFSREWSIVMAWRRERSRAAKPVKVSQNEPTKQTHMNKFERKVCMHEEKIISNKNN